MYVDLLVRSWVEICSYDTTTPRKELSTSSWGRELKCKRYWCNDSTTESTSSWGCELKCNQFISKYDASCRPPREVVSWNEKNSIPNDSITRRPPREVVSWNETNLDNAKGNRSRPPREVVSWNTGCMVLEYSKRWKLSTFLSDSISVIIRSNKVELV